MKKQKNKLSNNLLFTNLILLQQVFLGKKRVSGAFYQTIYFVLFFLLFFSTSYFLLSFVPLKALASLSSKTLLGLMGKDFTIVFENNSFFLKGSEVSAEINDLCSARIELSALFAVIFSSIDRSIRKRLLGVFFAFFFVQFVNGLRISLTLLFTSSPVFLALVHELLFKTSILLIVVFFYGAWYWLSRN